MLYFKHKISLYKKKNKIDVHRVTIYDNKYYDETIDTKSGKKS